jgi:hypothetical protein
VTFIKVNYIFNKVLCGVIIRTFLCYIRHNIVYCEYLTSWKFVFQVFVFY